jgi:hypothetical protein
MGRMAENSESTHPNALLRTSEIRVGALKGHTPQGNKYRKRRLRLGAENVLKEQRGNGGIRLQDVCLRRCAV